MSHPSPTREGVVHWTARCEHPNQALGAICELCGALTIDEICELCDAESQGLHVQRGRTLGGAMPIGPFSPTKESP
jgi:hypothetical protein